MSFCLSLPARRNGWQMNQAIWWENDHLLAQQGVCYGCSQHYHYVVDSKDERSYGGAMMVHSMMTEMIANVS